MNKSIKWNVIRGLHVAQILDAKIGVHKDVFFVHTSIILRMTYGSISSMNLHYFTYILYNYMDVSKNNGTPKSSILIYFNIK